MNTTRKPYMLDALDRLKIRPRARTLLTILCSILLSVGFTGCSFLKPAKPTARYYVLTPVAASQSGSGSLAVGLGQIKLPPYLFNTSLAVRKGTNEVEYLDSALWAERLDAGFQRVLAANLAIVLPTEQVRISAWQKDDVAAEIYVTIEQFDVDAGGQGVLNARWRILSPGGEKVLKTGSSRLSRPGPPPDASASGAVATLSELVGDLSRQLAQALKEAPLASRNSPSQHEVAAGHLHRPIQPAAQGIRTSGRRPGNIANLMQWNELFYGPT